MRRSIFSFLKWTPITAVLLTALVFSMQSSKAKNQPASSVEAAPGVDLSNEERIIGKYADDLAAYDKQAAELGKKARLVNADLDAVQRRSSELSDRLSEVQNAIREVVGKLKAAGEWDGIETTIAARITDSNRKRKFQESSFKEVLADAASNLVNHRDEIGVPLETLRKRLTSQYRNGADSQIVRAAYTAPAPVMIKSARCMLAGIRVGVSGFVRGDGSTSDRAQNGLECYCWNVPSACSAL